MDFINVLLYYINMKRQLFIKKIFYSPLFSILGIILIALLVNSMIKTVKNFHQIDNKIESLEQKANHLEQKNLEVVNLIKYFKNKEFIEEQARLKLNLQKKGEKVVVVTDNSLDDKNKIEDKKNSETIWQVNDNKTKEKPNPYKWWEYFFIDN